MNDAALDAESRPVPQDSPRAPLAVRQPVYIFDTSVLIDFQEDTSKAERWLRRLSAPTSLLYHPITLGEIAAQTHPQYIKERFPGRTPEQLQRTASARGALMQVLGRCATDPDARWLGRRFLPFDTSSRPSTAEITISTCYHQLATEKMDSRNLFRNKSLKVGVLADMVDHIILSTASYLRAHRFDVSLVSRDAHLLAAAARVNVRWVHPSNERFTLRPWPSP